ncbi:conserved hypothetical protein [Culex quinquefasciatus]|uniref:HAUS augmin-like complex subunit 6 N-terminal domain-containing protein n=1 Tax=Culex quinquefasciatus TaxID=7176 RepID=B0WZT1_CULQU|nr:conserved hypothetical protein [Culex quinquefasciatus]|eukprot:XP_001862903.1 conserved hypothetical protein [Culex quinquefasciatus]
MNKTVLKRSNTLSNVANISASEEQLDGAIFYCLNALAKRHTPSEQFRAIFVKGMFLKPNTKAFIHVLHFLFNVYDVKEFRKRFYWPIYDKNAESAFRSSTVEYVNSLVERGKLDGMERIKAHTVVLPGGAKFMKFLLVLIKFVLKEELRRAGGGATVAEGKIVSRRDVEGLVEYHREWDEIGAKMREIVQKDLAAIQSRIGEVDELLEEMFRNCDGPARQMSFEKLMQLWGTFNRKRFEENEERRQRMRVVTEEYNKVIVTARRKLEPKELTLGINEDDLKETLYRLEVLYPDNACHFREVFDENGKIDAVKMFEILTFMLPEVTHHFASFSVRSVESLKFELKEISKVAVKSDTICHELASLRRSLPFIDAKFQELDKQDELDELNNDLGIRNKIFNTPPITLNFQEATEGNTRPTSKRNRLALLDDDQVHQLNLRMRILSSSICQAVPRTPRSARKPKPPSSPNVFAVPKPARKEKMNPLSMLNKITAQGKPKSTPQNLHPVNSTMNISSLSDISLRPEFSSTLLGTPEKQLCPLNRRSINANETLTAPPPEPTPPFQPSPRLKSIYSEDKPTPDPMFLLGPPTKRRSSLLQLDQLQTSPSGRLEPLVGAAKGSGIRRQSSGGGGIVVPRIRITELNGDADSGIGGEEQQQRRVGEVDMAEFDDDGVDDANERTLNVEETNKSGEDLSSTLIAVAIGKLSLTDDLCLPAAEPASSLDTDADQPPPPPTPSSTGTNDEDLFNVSDGILTDFD